MESLGGDQRWFDRFAGQHSAIAYYLGMIALWLISPTLASAGKEGCGETTCRGALGSNVNS